MRTLSIFVALTIFSVSIDAQTINLKSVQKKPAGTVKPGFKYGLTNGQQTLKSTAVNRFANAQSLTFPGYAGTDKPLVIRKGNAPIYIERGVNPLKLASNAIPEERFYTFLKESRAITKIESPRESFKISDIETDNLGITHIRSVQQYKGVEIYGTESILHMDNEKERFNGSFCLITKDIPILPKFSTSQCLQTIQRDLKNLTVLRDLTQKEKKLLHYEAPDYALKIYNKGYDYALAWEVTIRPNFIEEWKYFLDAINGDILHKYNNTKTDGPTTGSGYDLNNQLKTFDVFLESGTYYLYNSAESMYSATTDEGLIITFDAQNTSTEGLNYAYVTSANNTWNQKAAISAHVGATLTYEYFHNTFGRNSINGKGGDILSFVNVAESDGSSMENAFWNGQAAFYGNGGAHFKPLAGALDVTAHELGHGVVSNSANLEYQGQSGAMNESYADIFGSMVDRTDWNIGEDVVITSPTGTLRNMADPHNGGDVNNDYYQPAHLSEMYLGTQDNGGVHINSGIGNYAYYLFATANGKNKAEQVYYRALTKYLTPTSAFIEWRIAVIQSAKDLYGSNSREAVSAAEAFTAVGIQEEEVEDNPPSKDYETNPGDDFLLSYNVDPDYPGTLYRTSTAGGNYVKLTSSIMKRNVSVTDDGSHAYFVTKDDSIKAITLDPDDISEWIVSPDKFWDNVAISKDRNRMACISVEVDTAIYVYDFVSHIWEKFMLYNPTTSDDGIEAGGVLYADAIEFDITGEYLIYDALNVLSSNNEDDIHYWDIGFINVWNNASGDFGSGKISKLFTSLPKNVSIGNPIFSKNTPSIIAFDYKYDDKAVEDDEVYAVYGGNLESGLINRITYITTWGYPSFSKNDDKIAFTALTTVGDAVVAYVDLEEDKISAAGDASILIDGSIWPVYYATGDRTLGLVPVADFTVDKKTGSAPLKIQFLDLSTNEPSAWLWTFQGGTPSSSTLQNPEVTYNTAGTYQVTLKATNSIGNNTKTKPTYLVISASTGLPNDEASLAGFYPNPMHDLLTIACDGNFMVKIFNLQGSLMLSAENEAQLDVSVLSPGVYLMELRTGNGLSRHKLLKQ